MLTAIFLLPIKYYYLCIFYTFGIKNYILTILIIFYIFFIHYNKINQKYNLFFYRAEEASEADGKAKDGEGRPGKLTSMLYIFNISNACKIMGIKEIENICGA